MQHSTGRLSREDAFDMKQSEKHTFLLCESTVRWN